MVGWGPPEKKNKSLDLDAAWLLSSWWLNQPIWKICSSNWMISPRFGFKIKNVWNHHLAIVDTSENKIGWRKFTIKNVWSFTTHLFSSPQFLQRFFAYEILRQVDNGVLQGHLVMAAISAGRVIQPACTDTSPKVTSRQFLSRLRRKISFEHLTMRSSEYDDQSIWPIVHSFLIIAGWFIA